MDWSAFKYLDSRFPVMRRRYKAVMVLLIAVSIGVTGFFIWAEMPLGPMPEALEALNSDAGVEVTVGSWLVFRPLNATKKVGFIVYPGGRVDYRSYAPTGHAIAAKGYLVIIVRMPLNLAVFGVNLAQDVIGAFPEVEVWAIGGHSLGGSMAAQYTAGHPSAIKGLILWASYPPSGVDLSGQSVSVVTIRGNRDGLVSKAQIEGSLKMLPPATISVEVLGGNHAQFGWYGPQPGDNEAEISRAQQQTIIVDETLQLLTNLN